MKKFICTLIGHRWTQHTYGRGIAYIGTHCWRCKKGLPESAHGYEYLLNRKGSY